MTDEQIKSEVEDIISDISISCSMEYGTGEIDNYRETVNKLLILIKKVKLI